MKKFAYYLPQFHCIPENDKWWGNGFTEWTNVKNATPLFEGHIQPIHPLNNNYYTLDDPSVLRWQADLANKYHIDGMIFYHYYFEGKKLLEKPAEILLNHSDIPMHYFFCWANHSWFRSWEGSKELLIEQTYGDEKDWESHFMYLLPFFKDARYEKIDNKPVFMIYKSDFSEKEKMISFFDELCRKNGFSGIEIIETVEPKTYKNGDALFSKHTVHYREPATTLNEYRNNPSNILFRISNKIRKGLRRFNIPYVEKYNGNIIFKRAASHVFTNPKIIRGLCFSWDNTPRHGIRGYIITPPTKALFFDYMDTIKNSDYLFINAWNEWAEGMMLEPTAENGYKYLEWIEEWSEINDKQNS